VDICKAIRLLHRAYPSLTIDDTAFVASFLDPATGKTVLDLIKPTRKVLRLAFRHRIQIGDTHSIPDLEMALVTKFATMTSTCRERLRKMQDMTDFAVMVAHNKKSIKLAKLKRLAENVCPGGGEQIKKLMDDILADRPLHI
jgi:hypothetical protein